MKVFFPVFQWAKPSMQGVLKKVSDQTKALRSLVEEIRTTVYGYHEKKCVLDGDVRYENIEPTCKRYLLQLWQVRKKSFELALKDIEQFHPDIIYTRYPLGDPTSIDFLKKIPYRIPLVFEQQSITVKELKVLNKPVYILFEKAFGHRLVNLSSGIVGVTDEIVQYESSRLKTQRAILVSNGVGVSSVPLRSPPPFDQKRLEILFVGSTNPWHGLDRLLFGLEKYRGKVEIKLHIVGIEEDDSIRSLAKTLSIQERVQFYGFRTGQELTAFFDICHIGAGSFGGHRKGLLQSAGLKMREYCARGLPFFLGHKDPDFPFDYPFCAFFPANEEPIDFHRVIEFYTNAFSYKNHAELMREYAFKNLDWSVKMKKTVEFFEQILKERG
ncbi:MAG TPA: glycosyltransferase [Thermotogota bacterium]|jgi:glycosyltransferase involved in cell wall biosynthesis|nr:glycosyltransferase [Thermotogota bacterium]OQC31017.1 MAG: Glycosyl transferases group 1 [Thermotogota bacterium ADurb.Bin062]HNW47549.1 glycosyltransferase [Thermotogota bacterium]HOF24147.1 glycosyltransferase [Thermotogota bacterium]HOH13643.1 glycosyltransferase [Thermotogota bacterium]